MKIGIIIPTYEEHDNIRKIFHVFKKIKNIQFFFCFVDGSHTNKTRLEIKKYFKKNFQIILEKKKNKIDLFKLSTRCEASLIGFKWMIKNKKIDLITDMDADLSSDPKDIVKAIKIFKKKKSDLIIGSKYLPGVKIINRKLLRAFCSKIYTFVCRILISKNISDYSAGFRFYSVRSLKKLVAKKQRYRSPSQHLENLLFYYENKFKIDEFPAQYKDTGGNSKSVFLTHIIIYIFQLSNILIKFYLRRLKKLNL